MVLHAGQAGAKVILGSMGEDAGLAIAAHDEPRITLAIGKNGTSLNLSDANGRSRLRAGLYDKDGMPLIYLSDESRRPRLMMSPDDFRMKDQDGRVVFSTQPNTTDHQH